MTELEKAAIDYSRERLSNDDYPVYNDEYEIELAFEAGVEWQREQFEKNNRIPTYSEAIEYGRNIASEQAMKYLHEHHSPSEVSDFQAAMNIAVAKAIDSTINKACEWLNNFYSEDRHCFLVKEDIEAFKQAMEE